MEIAHHTAHTADTAGPAHATHPRTPPNPPAPCRRRALVSAAGLIVAAVALAAGTLFVAFLVALSGFGKT